MQTKFHKIALYCFSVLCFLWISDAYGQAKEHPLTITNISLNRKTFFSDKDAAIKISYKLSGDAFVAIRFYNDRDIRVRTLSQNEMTASGSHSAEWDGKNDSGEQLPSGVYIYTIEAKRNNGERVMYDPADETGGILLKVREPLLDTESGEISYVMPKAGMVRIRAGIKEGPLLKTIIDWEPMEAGKNVEKWDGKDKSGLIDLFRIPKREAHIFAYSLPDNCIILTSFPGSAWERSRDGSAVLSKTVPEYRAQKKTDPKLKYEHALHKKSVCHEPEFQVIFPPDSERTPEAISILKGSVPVKIVISERDRHHLESERFEVMFFVDTVFIFEDEEGFTPFTYMWNTKDLSEGEHVFTVNIFSYDDHCGVESRKIIIRR